VTWSPSGGTASGAPRAMDCAEARTCLGVYVLGAIDPAERTLADAHLATCRECRDELAGLAGLPALLSRVSAEEAAALAVDGSLPAAADGAPDPRPGLPAAVLSVAAARRRRRFRDIGIGIAAALVIAAGAVGGLHLGQGSRRPRRRAFTRARRTAPGPSPPGTRAA
jgi:anti-sigma factor RsiW